MKPEEALLRLKCQMGDITFDCTNTFCSDCSKCFAEIDKVVEELQERYYRNRVKEIKDE